MSGTALALLLMAGMSAEPLSESRAIELALADSAALKALACQVEETRAMVDVDTKLQNPELRLTKLRSDRLVSPALSDEEYREHPFEDVSVGLRWKPPDLGALGAKRAQAERRVDQANAELEKARRELTARVRTLHATVLGLDAQIALARSGLEQRDLLRTLVKRRLDEQAATVLDQSLADVDYLESLSRLQDLESQRRLKLHELLVLVGLPPDAHPELVGDPEGCEAPSEQVTQLVERAKAGGPWLDGYQARLAEADAERSQLELERIPWIKQVMLSYVVGGGESDPGRVELGLAVNLSLLDWNTADVRAVSARRARYEQEYRAEQQELAGELRRGLEEWVEQASVVRRYREAEPVLADGVARLQKAAAVAETDLLQIAEVQARVLSVKRAHLKAALDCQLTRIEIDRLTGGIPVAAPAAPGPTHEASASAETGNAVR
jgi:outer membrane protein TolC